MPEGVPAPLRTDELPETPIVPARAPGTYCTCEFCGCQVTRSGEVYAMSDKARGYRDSAESHRSAVASLDTQIEDLKRQLREKETELSALRAPQRQGKSIADALL